MDNINRATYRLPSHWIGPLFNDDYSGFSNEEEKAVRDFLASVDGHAVDTVGNSEDFNHTNDAGTLPCTCSEYVFTLPNQ